MLTHMHVRHFALVDELNLEISQGMTALTGETGAGKSILIDALSLALGDRATPESIRHGKERAEITLHFDVENLKTAQNWLTQYGLDVENDCILRRIINQEGRSRAFINGNPVPIQRLKEIGQLLIDIHGQHAHHSLLDPSTHEKLFDDFAGTTSLKLDVARHFKQFQQTEQSLLALQQQATDRQQRLDFLQYQITQLEELHIQENEWHFLCEKQKKLAHREQLLSETADIQQILDQQESNINQLVTRCINKLIPIIPLCEKLNNAHQLFSQAKIYLDEAANELASSFNAVSHDPKDLQEIELRLSAIHDLGRKHRIDPNLLPDLLISLLKEHQELSNTELSMHALTLALLELKTAYNKAATILSQARKNATTGFNQSITTHMQALGLTGGEFFVDLLARNTDKESPHGFETIVFSVRTNPGQPARPLHKIASGGELSRISLAIEVANLEHGSKPVLIFDEVDVGIGGSVADCVGQYLHRLSTHAQILCVTHLAQVAAHADNHFKILKTTDESETFSSVISLSHPEKIEEIARMVGGVHITPKTRLHAKEMLAVRAVSLLSQ